jgi:cytochrome c-type biogenesis protein CcmE
MTDLSPRKHEPLRRQKRGFVPILLVVLMVFGIGFVLFKTLSDASLFFLNVDEAVEQRDDFGDSRFRMQGAPVAGTVYETSMRGQSAVAFTVEFGCSQADVVHLGDPAELFQPTVPVVLEGSWEATVDAELDGYDGVDDGFYFVSDRMLVKHDNEYRTDFDGRIAEAKAGGGCAS